jgi:hypothetical protein
MLMLTFPDGTIAPDTPFDALTPLQQWVMRAVASARNLWQTSNFADALGSYGLPASGLKVIGEPNPFMLWSGLRHINRSIEEANQTPGNILVMITVDQEDAVRQAMHRADDRLGKSAWSQEYDEAGFTRFLADLFDAHIDEFVALYPGTRVSKRSDRQLELVVGGTSPRPTM